MIVDVKQVANKSFDYIIVGGGVSYVAIHSKGHGNMLAQLTGLVVAARLSEDTSISVLVIEAGEANIDDPLILSPTAISSHLGNEKYDWKYETTPQAMLGGRVVPWPRGKGLGGSSAINYLQFHLPARSDIDAWEELGNGGWNWALLKSYSKKVERFVAPKTESDAINFDLAEHGTDGPLVVAYPRGLTGLEVPYQQALKSLGIERAADPASGNTLGTWLSPICVDPETCTRTYSVNAYYSPHASRKNLLVLPSARVVQIETTGDAGSPLVATDIIFAVGEDTFAVQVSKEVILAAGAIESPQILELSGIGDESLLAKVGVKPKYNLPGVGGNVQEHLMIHMSFEMENDPEEKYATWDCLRDPVERQKQRDLFDATGTGVFSMSPTCKTFVPLSAISHSSQDLQESLKTSLANGEHSAALRKQHAIYLDHIAKSEPSCELSIFPGALKSPKAPPLPGKKYLSLNSFLNHPFSRGSIHISSNDYKAPAAIEPRYFEEQYDLVTLVECMKFNRRITQQEPLKSILSGLELFPGAEYDTDEKLASYVKEHVGTTFHATGTCSMLPLADGGVVDTSLKVYGSQNIRVVDASIVPLQVGAHIQGIMYAIAEIAADIIKGNLKL